jgi:hypothetical protein
MIIENCRVAKITLCETCESELLHEVIEPHCGPFRCSISLRAAPALCFDETMDRWKLLMALVALSNLSVIPVGAAQDQLTIDATQQTGTPLRGRGPFPGSAIPGHSSGLPIHLALQMPSRELQPDGATLVDFLVTNAGTEPLKLPVSTDCRLEFTDVLSLWFSSDAIKDQFFIDQETGRQVKMEVVPVSAVLCGRSNDPGTFRMVTPNETFRVRAFSPQLNPGTYSFIAHAELLRLARGSSQIVGTSDAEPATKTVSPAAR